MLILFMSESIFYIILGFFALWLLVLSVGLFQALRLFNRLAKGTKGNLSKVLEKILAVQDKNKKTLTKLDREIKKLEDEGTLHVQKVGFVRFNPFQETGGDHSFSVALLNGKDTGLILTGLHTRERTRIYLKAIKRGKSEFELSKEEKKALTKALKGR